jgi:hypothetical protein
MVIITTQQRVERKGKYFFLHFKGFFQMNFISQQLSHLVQICRHACMVRGLGQA